MKLELIWSNEGDIHDDVLSAIERHRRASRQLSAFVNKCDTSVTLNDFAAARLEALSEDEQLALRQLAKTSVENVIQLRAKAQYLAELLDADPESLSAEDLVMAFRSLA